MVATVEPPPDRLTREEIAEQMARHERMCWKIAYRFKRRNAALSLEDLVAAARLGMLEGAARFEPARGFAFATYCHWYATDRVRRLVKHELGRGLKVPMNGELVKPSVGSIDAAYRVGGAEYHRQARLTVADSLAAPEPDGPPPLPADFWERAVKALNGRAGRALALHFRDGLTYAEIAQQLGVSRTRVGQIVARALRRLQGDRLLRSQWEDLR